MNATYRFAVKACLLAAVSGALFNQAVGLFAQDGNSTPDNGAAVPKIRQTAGVQSGTAAAPQSPASQGPSEVQKQLREIYRKNGREMPSMNLDDLPNTQAPVPSATAPVQVAPNGPVVAPNAPPVKPGKPNWFERTFRVGRGKKQPPPVAQPTRPPVQGMPQPQPRYATMQPAARPTPAPTYRAPVVTVTPVPQTPAEPALREPAPIGIPGGVSDLAARPAPPATRSGERSGISSPLMDDSAGTEDSETLDLNQDEHPKFVNQAAQIRPNQPEERKSESPYTGLTISPNEMEQKIGSAPNPIPDLKFAREKESSADAEPSPASISDSSVPAARSEGAEVAQRSEKGATTTAEAGKPKDDPRMIDDADDEDDEDDKDDKPLTLPIDDSEKPARKPTEMEKPASLPADQGAEEKPARVKVAEKPAAPAQTKGFRGFCPVILKDERKLVEARPHIRSEYRGKMYTFSTAEAKEAFDENPRKYIPAGDGQDVVRHATGESGVEGTLEHAAWYRGRLYLFSSADTRREFVEAPSKFVVND